MDSTTETTHIITSSENTNNENREKELSGFQANINNENIEKEKTTNNENTQKNEEVNEKEYSEINNQVISTSEVIDNSNKDNKTDNEIDISDNINQKGNNEENKENEKEEKKLINNTRSLNNQTNDVNTDEYSKHVAYNELGEAIYTDPITKYKYRWSQDKNDWELLENSVSEVTATTTTNPYENEHYRWCNKTNQWIPKIKENNEVSSEGGATGKGTETIETEFYRWDKETNQWIPKIQSSNVVYGYEDGVHTYTDHDGTVYFWDTEKNAWFPKIDDDFMAMYQMNYGFIDNTSLGENKESNKNVNVAGKQENIKSTEVTQSTTSNENAAATGEDAKPQKRKIAEPPKWFDLPPEQNTKVYVSNLPEDITEEEFVQVMSKCGLIMRDPQTQKYKIKLYAESNGQLKGDGLCDYIKVESVDLALNLLDGYDIRGHKIKVQRAQFQMRGEYNPALKPKRKKKDKEKLQKMKERLFDWRPEKLRGERSKHERIVIIKNLFDPELFDKEVHLIIEYQNDLREECSKCGTVRKVVIFDRHPDGVAQITMSSPEEADSVVQMMNRRYFGQRRLIAEIWDGKTKYKIAETDAEIQKRISNWDKFLEEDDANKTKEKQKNQDQEKNLNSNKVKLNEEENDAELDS